MNEEMKVRWIEALRSGKYAQGKTNLRDAADNFCCLGVLCDLYDPNHWEPSEYAYRYSGHSAMLPENIHAAINLDFDAGDTLMQMNDLGDSFNEIADYIEKNL